MKAATRVWLATALLQRERGRNADFENSEIAGRIESAQWTSGLAPQTLSAHISGHCVASGRPSPDRDRMLTRTRRGHYRLYRHGDPTHPGRAAGRVQPDEADVPEKYRDLLRWYENEYLRGPQTGLSPVGPAQENGGEIPPHLVGVPAGIPRDDPLLELRRIAMESGIWKGIDPDEYVRELRAGWD